MNVLKNNKGMTLVEILAAATILAIAATAIFSFYMLNFRVISETDINQNSYVEAQSNLARGHNVTKEEGVLSFTLQGKLVTIPAVYYKSVTDVNEDKTVEMVELKKGSLGEQDIGEEEQPE